QLRPLRGEQDASPIDAVGDHSPDQGEENDRRGAQEGQKSGVAGLVCGRVKDPTQRRFLQPGARTRSERAEPQQPEIAVAERMEDPRESVLFLFDGDDGFWRGGGFGHSLDCDSKIEDRGSRIESLNRAILDLRSSILVNW